jgi:putative oxidoreductase
MAHVTALAASLGDRLRSFVLLVIRLTWGFQLAESGWGHWTHLSRTIGYFRSLHIPAPQLAVGLSATTELAGGILLILGLFARLVSLPLVFNFCVAYATASFPDLVTTFHQKGWSDAYDAFINDSAFPFLIMALVILAFGAGRISLDAARGAGVKNPG